MDEARRCSHLMGFSVAIFFVLWAVIGPKILIGGPICWILYGWLFVQGQYWAVECAWEAHFAQWRLHQPPSFWARISKQCLTVDLMISNAPSLIRTMFNHIKFKLTLRTYSHLALVALGFH